MELYLQRAMGQCILWLSTEEADATDYPPSRIFDSVEDALDSAQAELDSGAYPGGLFLIGFEEESKAEL